VFGLFDPKYDLFQPHPTPSPTGLAAGPTERGLLKRDAFCRQILWHRLTHQIPNIMKKVLLLAAFSFFFFGCNMNPSKEARLQKLEAEIQHSIDKISQLESSLQTLELENQQLKTRVDELENQ
jgi:hypothetical protein